ncbi:MAG: 1,2-phenylacetyl-CoA epoxidase subunit PaaD [Ramlibacter sp.]
MSTRTERAWDVLGTVLDPEVPALSVRDLGIVRDVIDHGDELEVVLTPTYSGCPATEAIEADVLAAISAQGLGPARATLRRAPAWTSDWISEDGKRKLREYGIAPPHSVIPAEAGIQGVRIQFMKREPMVACPHCASPQTERLSPFGSTACKSLYRCLACREPFEYFKPI